MWATNDVTTLPVATMSLSSARQFAALIINGLQFNVYVTIVDVLVLVLLRGVVRRTWIADTLFVILLSLGSLGIPATFPATVLLLTCTVMVLRRFGLLGLAAFVFASGVPGALPFVVTSWYSAYSLTSAGILLAAAGWAMAVVLKARRT